MSLYSKDAKKISDQYNQKINSHEYKLKKLFDAIKKRSSKGFYDLNISSDIDYELDQGCLINLTINDLEYLQTLGYQINNFDVSEFSDEESQEYHQNFRIENGKIYGLLNISWF